MPIPTANLRFKYDFQNGSYPGSGTSVFDLSGNGVTANILSGGTYVSGTPNYFDLNGDTNIQANNAAISTNTNITINIWGRPSFQNDGNGYGNFGSVGNDGVGTIPFIATSTIGGSNVQVGGGNGYGGVATTNPIYLDTSKWYLYTLTSNSSTGTSFYIDGVLIGTDNDWIRPQTAVARLGSYDSVSYRGFSDVGYFDFHNTALSAATILSFYNESKVDYDNLVVSYDFSDPACYSGSGNTFYSLESALNGTVNSTTYVSNGQKSYFQTNGSSTFLETATFTPSSNTVFSYSLWFQRLDNTFGTILKLGGDASSPNTPAININDPSAGRLIQSFGFNVGVSSPTETFAINEWHNIIVTCDGTNEKVYYDGVLVNTVSQSSGIFGTGRMLFGRFESPAQYASLRIAKFDLWNVTLTAGEITTLYNQESLRFDNLIISYDFSDPACYPGTGNTVFDLSGSGINATVQSAVTFDSAGNQSSFIFNNSWPNTNIEANFDPPSQTLWTFNTWIYPTVDTLTTFIFAGDSGNGSGPYVAYNGSWPSILNTFLSSNGFGTGTISATSYPYAKNNWYMVSYSSDGTTLKLYVNATQIGSASAAGVALPAGVIPFRLGGNTDTAYQFTGKIAIAQFYDKALTSGEITTIYNNTVSRFAPAPPAYQGSVGGRQFAQGFNG